MFGGSTYARAGALLFLLLVPRLAIAGCAPVASQAPRIWPAGGSDTDVTITFLGHASFEIASPQGVRAVTDYNGITVPTAVPDIATMNHAHDMHYTLFPDPRIHHVPHGWRENGQSPAYDLRDRDPHVSNLPTNIRAGSGSALSGDNEANGNSVFVFETAGLCIAHLSHLHHLLEPADLAALGRVDVVMVAIDGTWTMSQRNAGHVLEQLQPSVVLPMHYVTRDVLTRFLEQERGQYAIDMRDRPTIMLSRSTLPATPTIIALSGFQ